MAAEVMPKITLISSDNQSFLVDRKVVRQSRTLDNMMKDLNMDDSENMSSEGIPLPLVQGEFLKQVIEWCEQHKEDVEPERKEDDSEKKEEERGGVRKINIPDWDKKFLEQKDMDTVKELMMAANYLDIKKLFEYCGMYIAGKINACKSVEEIRTLLNITNDFTPAEEAELKAKNAWAEEL